MRCGASAGPALPSLCLFVLLSLVFVEASPAKGKEDSFIEITVKKGDTLTVIARRYLDDPRRWRELLQYNKVPRPNLILPGRVLRVPGYLARKPVAVVTRYSRSAEYTADERDDWADVAVALGLHNRDRLRTNSSGSVALALQDVARLMVRENSYVVIMDRKPAKSGALGVLLRSGRMESLVTPDGRKKTTFQITTPAAVVAVRGTDFTTVVDADRNTAVACNGGAVDVSAQGKTVRVRKGFAVFVKRGSAPGAPFAILRPPQVELGP